MHVCCESTVDVMINYILWMTRRYRVKENEGFETPPLYSLPCVVHLPFVSRQPSCVAIDGVVLAETRCRPCLLLVFTPCASLSTCLLPLVLCCPCSCVCVMSYTCWCPHSCMQSFPYLVSLCRPGGAYASVCLGGYMATPCFPVSGYVGDLECQTEVAVFASFVMSQMNEAKTGSAQRASGATPTRSSHRCDECVASGGGGGGLYS